MLINQKAIKIVLVGVFAAARWLVTIAFPANLLLR